MENGQNRRELNENEKRMTAKSGVPKLDYAELKKGVGNFQLSALPTSFGRYSASQPVDLCKLALRKEMLPLSKSLQSFNESGSHYADGNCLLWPWQNGNRPSDKRSADSLISSSWSASWRGGSRRVSIFDGRCQVKICVRREPFFPLCSARDAHFGWFRQIGWPQPVAAAVAQVASPSTITQFPPFFLGHTFVRFSGIFCVVPPLPLPCASSTVPYCRYFMEMCK